LFRVNQDADERGYQMSTRSVTTQKAALLKPDSIGVGTEKPAVSRVADKSGHDLKPQKIFAVFLNPTCEHDWLKLENDLQTLEAEGKTIWKCSTCAEITNTYDWQTP
jgi:hypothetical protein